MSNNADITAEEAQKHIQTLNQIQALLDNPETKEMAMEVIKQAIKNSILPEELKMDIADE